MINSNPVHLNSTSEAFQESEKGLTTKIVTDGSNRFRSGWWILPGILVSLLLWFGILKTVIFLFEAVV